MINAEHIRELAEKKLSENDSFLVDVTVSPTNRIRITIDKEPSVSVADCANLSRWLEKQLDRDTEDFDLEVSSPGLDQPLRVIRQYEKNIGRDVEIRLTDGRKTEGRLVAANKETIEIEQQSKEKTGTGKKKQLITRRASFPMNEVKETRIVIKFKQ